MNINTCVCCGTEIPEGRMVCSECESKPQRGTKCLICDEFIPLSPIEPTTKICENCRRVILRLRGMR